MRLKIKKRYLPQSSLGKAIDYTLGQWNGLGVFLENGRVEIGRVENRRGGGRLRESLFPAVFTKVPVPHSQPLLRFLFPLLEPDLQLYRIRLSSPIDKLSLSIGWHDQRAA